MSTFLTLPETMSRALRTATPLLLCMAACKRTEHVPAYLDLTAVSLSTDLSQEGSNSERITDAWVFLNDQTMGVWEVPSKVPMIASGTQSVKLIAGVMRNGVQEDRVQYPFFETWSGSVDLVPEGHTDLAPVFSYFEGLSFWIEDFEGTGIQFDAVAPSDTTMITETADPFEGSASGAIHLDATHDFNRSVTNEDFDAAAGGSAWLELDYRCDHRFLIGAYYTVSGTVVVEPYLFVVSSGMAWKKIYVDLTPVFAVSGSSDRKFYFEMELEPGETTAQVHFDNVKLIHP